MTIHRHLLRFSLRSYMVFVLIASIVLALVMMRLATVYSFNSVSSALQTEMFDFHSPVAGLHFRGDSSQATFNSSGHFNHWVQQERGYPFCLNIRCRSTGLVSGRTVVEVARVMAVEEITYDPENNRAACEHFVSRLPKSVQVITYDAVVVNGEVVPETTEQ